MSYLVLYSEEYEEIKKILNRLKEETNSRIVIVVERNGQPIAFTGELDGVDTTSLGSLIAGDVAATEALARLLGEQGFSIIFNEGAKEDLHITVIGDKFILAILFDRRTSLGLVRLRARKAAQELEGIFKRLEEKMASQRLEMGDQNPLDELTEDDIENLFK